MPLKQTTFEIIVALWAISTFVTMISTLFNNHTKYTVSFIEIFYILDLIILKLFAADLLYGGKVLTGQKYGKSL